VLRRILWLVLAFPGAVALITLAIANRHPVQMVLDPFRPEAPLLSVSLPFFAYLLGALIAGVVLGGLATWITQGRYRRNARLQSSQARRWQVEADRLARERDKDVTQRNPQLVPPRRDAA
jgi:uncharacterized integral membrane protein